WKVLNGFLNVATLGVFGLIKKLAKSCIGYTQRFGFLNNGTDDFSIVQNTFKDAIDLATKGEFPNIAKGDVIGFFRPFIRFFYGFQHKLEDILKTYHDAYLKYASEIQATADQPDSNAYKMYNFFNSQHFKDAKKTITLRNDEEDYCDQIENYLGRTLSYSS